LGLLEKVNEAREDKDRATILAHSWLTLAILEGAINEKAAISGGPVTTEQTGLLSTAFPQERCGLDRRPVSPRYTPTAIGAARIPSR
jgi:hypothetical protein